MITFNLKKEWYDKIKSGQKTIEYREVKPYWDKRLNNMMKNSVKPNGTTEVWECILRLGYTKHYMMADILSFEIVNGINTDLKIDKDVYAIQLSNVREVC